jgi:hypothetical protein
VAFLLKKFHSQTEKISCTPPMAIILNCGRLLGLTLYSGHDALIINNLETGGEEFKDVTWRSIPEKSRRKCTGITKPGNPGEEKE